MLQMSRNARLQNQLGPTHQDGSMLVIVVVVMTVVLLLGLAMTRVLASSSNAVVYEVLGFRALNAARSGMEFNLSRVLNSGLPPSNLCTQGNVPEPLPSAPGFSSIAGLENCSFVATCRVESAGDSGDDYFRFTSRGTCLGGDDVIVSRVVAVDARL